VSGSRVVGASARANREPSFLFHGWSAWLASSSRSQVPGQAASAVARLTSRVVSPVVHQRPWLVVVEVTHG